MRCEYLMRKNLGAGIGELTAFVASQESSGEQLQLETPGVIPLTSSRALKRRIDTLKLGKEENLVLGTIRRLHEDGRIELNLGVLTSDLLNVADTVGFVEGVCASYKVAISEN